MVASKAAKGAGTMDQRHGQSDARVQVEYSLDREFLF